MIGRLELIQDAHLYFLETGTIFLEWDQYAIIIGRGQGAPRYLL